jgi:hypothetical protein
MFRLRALVAGGVLIGSLASSAAVPALASPGALTLSMTQANAQVNSGAQTSYTLAIGNPGVRVRVCDTTGLKPYCYYELDGSDAYGVVVQDTLPAGFSFVSASSDSGFACSASGSTVSCGNGTVYLGSTGHLSLNVRAATLAAGSSNQTVSNSASLNGTTVSVQTTVIAPPAPPTYPDLTITSATGPAHLSPGQSGTYTIQMANVGQAAANQYADLQWLSTWGGYVTGFSSTASNGLVCTMPLEYMQQTIRCFGGSLAPGATATATITLQAPNYAVSDPAIQVCANFDRAITESNTANNCTTLYTTVN